MRPWPTYVDAVRNVQRDGELLLHQEDRDAAARDLGQQAGNLPPANAPPDGVCSFGVIGASLTVETARRAAAPRAVRGCKAGAPIVSRRRRPPVNSALRLYGQSRNVERGTKQSAVHPQPAQEVPSAASSHRTASGPRLRYVPGPGRRPPTVPARFRDSRHWRRARVARRTRRNLRSVARMR